MFKKKFNVNLHGGMFSIGDQRFTPVNCCLEEYQDRIRNGKRISVHTGSDGICVINLKLINLGFPIFTKQENAAFIDNSPIYILHVPSGCISISDIDPEVTFKVPAGYYRIAINLHENPRTNNRSYYICLAPMKSIPEKIENPSQILELEL